MGSKRKHLVFISHSSLDTWIAKQLAREIKSAGAQPFLDEATIEVGADFEDEIRKFLEKAHELVVLMTPWALERKYVWAELGAAWGRRLPIIVLLQGMSAGELQNKAGVPNFLKKRDMIELNEVEQYLKELRVRVRRR